MAYGIKFLKIIILPTLLLLLSVSILEAARPRMSRKEKKAEKAIKTLQENSTELSILAGVDPLSNDSLQTIEIENIDETDSLGDEGEDLEELSKENEVTVDIDKLEMLWMAYLSEGDESAYTDNGIQKEEFMQEILNWLGTPYRFGGNSARGIDCSAFMRHLYKESLKIQLPRTANEQYSHGIEVEIDDLQFGDLVFFRTRRYAPITHVGVYLGDNLFAHASSRDGVTISSLESAYYTRTFKGGKRLTNSDITALEIETKDDVSAETVEEAQTGTK